MTSLENRDYFTDHSILKDPYAYFERIFSRDPVYYDENRDIYFVTGFQEAIEVLNNSRDFSSVISVTGAAVPLPFEPEGDDISEQLEEHRSEFEGSDLLVTYDDEQHAASRSLLNRLFTPTRLKANEEFMNEYADQLVRDAVARGGCELITELATPYAIMVIADLLGVPEDDREKFKEVIEAGPPPGNLDAEEQPHSSATLEFLGKHFYHYINDRRENPREDILTELATAQYPDGSTPDLLEVVKLSIFLFGAGQDTSAKLLGNSMRFLAENPEFQQQLREDRELVPPFIEEMLRLEGSTKATFRLARRTVTLGDKVIPAGKKLVVALSAGNRDPRRWEEPNDFKLKRPKVREHIAFGRGAHTCIGAPLARAEVRVILDRFLEHTADIAISEEKHGPAQDRKLEYEASFIIRGLESLHLKLGPR